MAEPTTGTLQVEVDGHKQRLKENLEEHDKIWKRLDFLSNRLPNWAVLLISVLCTAIGVLTTILVK